MNRRGACPTFSTPMQTGDGLLARLHPAGPMSLPTFVGLCRAAERRGNGILEVTQRGSLQVRGLRAETLAGFRTDVEALDVDAPEGVVVQTPPLSVHSLGPASGLREALRRSGIAARLAPKTTVVLDFGDGLPIDDLAADIRLQALESSRLHVGIGHAPVIWIGDVAAGNAGAAVIGMLEILAAAGPGTRARDLSAAAFRSAIARLLVSGRAPEPRGTADAVGRHSGAVGIGLPFGWTKAGTLQQLLSAAVDLGADRVWASPGRALVFESLPGAPAARFIALASALRFIVNPGDLRRRVVACIGAPGCASAFQPVRTLADDVAGIAALLNGDERIHLSGCAKGCAHPRRAAVTLVGWEAGFRLVLDGTPDGVSVASLSPTDVLAKLPDLLEKRRRRPEEAAARGVGGGRG